MISTRCSIFWNNCKEDVMKRVGWMLPAVVVIGGCQDPAVVAAVTVKAYVQSELDALAQNTAEFQSLAPVADADGWNRTTDGAAVAAMETSWRESRAHYERIEGAIAVLFPNYDESYDQRYDGFPGQPSDTNLFDSDGVSGNHAVERVLWSDRVPADVVAFESTLTGYIAPAFPANEQQADDFRTKLVQRKVDDTAAMAAEFEPLNLQLETAYRGVLGSMEEQVEKVRLAGTGEDESRYAQHTLADMRFNLEGGRAIFTAFEGMFASNNGAALYADVIAAFDRVQARYDAIDGDAIPAVPSDFDPATPGDSPYGQLFAFLATEIDPANEQGFVHLFGEGGELLSIPALPE
jgi:iron uptake system component EfeO